MNIDDFNKNLGFIHCQVDAVLASKGDEYSGTIDKDRLHNFKVAAGMQGITVKEALAGMMSKHTTSIYDMIGDGRDHSLKKWDEKILDHINYLILLRAIVVEEDDEARRKIKMDVNSMYPAAEAVSLPESLKARDIQSDKEQYLKPVDNFKSNIKFQGEDGAV